MRPHRRFFLAVISGVTVALVRVPLGIGRQYIAQRPVSLGLGPSDSGPQRSRRADRRRPIAKPHAAAGGGAGRSATRTYKRQRIEAHQIVAHDASPSPRAAFSCIEPAQAPVVLHPVLEFGVLRVGDLEVGQRREQLGVALDVRRRVAGDGGEQLPLIDQVAVAAQRRARPQVVRDAEALMRLGLACSS